MPFPFPILELFAGIGGFSAALAPCQPKVRAAMDIDRSAMDIYKDNHPHPVRVAEITSVDLSSYNDCFWWMSPPCLPFTQRGHQRDHLDPRSLSLQRIAKLIEELRPPGLALENVPPFADSIAWTYFREMLASAGYTSSWRLACPTALGIPMRRNRFYALAFRGELCGVPQVSALHEQFQRSLHPHSSPRRLKDYLTEEPHSRLSTPYVLKFQDAIDVADPDDQNSVAACFGSSYGKSIIRSGSYLRCDDGGLRYFSPREIANLLGLPDTFVLPDERRTAYRLLGNSLSIDVVHALFCPG